MKRPAWVTNEQKWNTHCRKIRARSRDLLEGRLGVTNAAIELSKLGFWVRADDDPDFTVFTAIGSECTHLPVGSVRTEWAADALQEKDAELRALEDRWRQRALTAAANLLKKYA